jgi:hypothetical protein
MNLYSLFYSRIQILVVINAYGVVIQVSEFQKISIKPLYKDEATF